MSNFEKEVLIVEQLICNQDYFKTTMPFLKGEWFSDPATNHIYQLIEEHSDKYDSAPTIETLHINLNDQNVSEKLYEETKELLSALSDKKQDAKVMFDTTEKYAKMRAIDIGLTKAIAIRSGEDKKHNMTAIPEILEQALAVNFNTEIGSFYFRDSGKYYRDYYSVGKVKFPFLISQLNEYTNGGVSEDSLNVVLAGINTGKTTWLINDCVEKTLAGHNTLYITLEVGEDVIRERADVKTLDTIFGEAEKMSEEEYTEKLDTIHKNCKAEMVIKEFPDGYASVANFRLLLRELKIQHGFVPKFVYVDYLTNASSETLDPSVKSNSNLYYGIVAQEFRAFAKVNNLIMWSAAQLTRSKQSSDDANLSDIGLAITISAIADFMIFLGAPEQLLDQNLAVARIIKNRYGHLKPKFIIGANQQKQTYYEVDNSKFKKPEASDYEEEEGTIRQEYKKTGKEPTLPGLNKKPVENKTNNLENWKF